MRLAIMHRKPLFSSRPFGKVKVMTIEQEITRPALAAGLDNDRSRGKRPGEGRYLRPESAGFLILLSLITAVQVMCTTLTLPALPEIARSFDTTTDQVQLTISGFLFGVACGQMLSGALADKFGRRPVMLGGLVISSLAGAGCTLAPTVESLIVFRVIQGFGASAGMILGRAIVRDCFAPANALRAMSTIISIIVLVPMAGPPVIGLLLHWVPWRAVYGLLTLVSLALVVMAWRWMGESLKAGGAREISLGTILRNIGLMIRRADYISFVLTGGLIYGGMFVYLALVPFVARDTFGLGAMGIGLLQGAMSLGSWVGAMISRRLSTRLSIRALLAFSTGWGIACILVAGIVAWAIAESMIAGRLAMAALFAPLVVFGISCGITFPVAITAYMRPVPEFAGTASALGATVQTCCGALFVTAVGYLYNGTPYVLVAGMAAGAFSAFAIFVFIGARHAPR